MDRAGRNRAGPPLKADAATAARIHSVEVKIEILCTA